MALAGIDSSSQLPSFAPKLLRIVVASALAEVVDSPRLLSVTSHLCAAPESARRVAVRSGRRIPCPRAAGSAAGWIGKMIGSVSPECESDSMSAGALLVRSRASKRRIASGWPFLEHLVDDFVRGRLLNCRVQVHQVEGRARIHPPEWGVRGPFQSRVYID